MLDPESKIQKVHFLVISYNYDCPKTNQMSLNLFTPNKIMKLVPGLRPGDLSLGKASLTRGEWFRNLTTILIGNRGCARFATHILRHGYNPHFISRGCKPPLVRTPPVISFSSSLASTLNLLSGHYRPLPLHGNCGYLMQGLQYGSGAGRSEG